MICPNAKCAREIPDDAMLCCYCGRTIVKREQAKKHQRGNGSGCAYRRGKTWTACVTPPGGCYRDENGRNHQKRYYKGGFKTRNEALAYIARLRQRSERPKKAPNLLHYWKLYDADELEKLSKDKQYAYRKAWQRCESLQLKPVNAITVNDLRSVVKDNTTTYYTAKDMKTLLGHLYDLAGADRWVDKDLPDFIILPELDEKERIPFNEDEQKALWKRYDAGDSRAAIPLVMIYTGMMPGELQNVKIDMIHLEAQKIIGASMKTKVRKKSPIYLPDTIMPVIIDMIGRSTSKNGYLLPRNEDKFYATYYAVLEDAGCRRLEPYSCRHTTATALAIDKSIAPQTIQKVMRWSTTRMLDRYAHPDDADAMNALNTLGRLSERKDAPEQPKAADVISEESP